MAQKTIILADVDSAISKVDDIEKMIDQAGMSESYEARVREKMKERREEVLSSRHEVESRVELAKTSGEDMQSRKFQSEIKKLLDSLIFNTESSSSGTKRWVAHFKPRSDHDEQASLEESERTKRDAKQETFDAEQESFAALRRVGAEPLPNVSCPHCQVRGKVYKKSEKDVTSTVPNSFLRILMGDRGTVSVREVMTYRCVNCTMKWV